MTGFAMAAFVAAAAAWSAAILAFPRARALVGPLALGALALCAAGTGLAALSGAGAPSFWSALFGAAGAGCGLTGWRQLEAKPERWVHRFVIYTGYGAVFAAMGVASLIRFPGAWTFAAALVSVWIAGSAAIFWAKNATLRAVQAEMPDYFRQWGAPGGW